MRLDRVEPLDALAAVDHGAVIIDIRSETQRHRDGVIPGALFYERNVLEWLIDPASGYSDPVLGDDLDRHLILVCNKGFQSSLAAGTLQDLGFSRAPISWAASNHGRRRGCPSRGGLEPSAAAEVVESEQQ